MWFAQKKRFALSLFNKEQQWENRSLHSLKKRNSFTLAPKKLAIRLKTKEWIPIPKILYERKSIVNQTHISCLLSHISWLTSPVSHILSHVSCLLSHLSSMQRWEFAHSFITRWLKSLRTNEQISELLPFLSKSLIFLFCSQKMSNLLKIKNKSYFLYVFCRFLLKFF